MRAATLLSDIIHFGFPNKVVYYPNKKESYFLHNGQQVFLFSTELDSDIDVQHLQRLVPKKLLRRDGSLATPVIEMDNPSLRQAYRNVAFAYLNGNFLIDAPVALNHTTHILPIPPEELTEIIDHVNNTMRFVDIRNGTPYPPYLTWPPLTSGRPLHRVEDLLARLVMWEVPHQDINAQVQVRIAHHHSPWKNDYFVIDRYWKQGHADMQSSTFRRYHRQSDRHVIWGRRKET